MDEISLDKLMEKLSGEGITLTKRTIAYYQQEGIFPTPSFKRGGKKGVSGFFDDGAVRTARYIHKLKEEGYPIKLIRKKMEDDINTLHQELMTKYLSNKNDEVALLYHYHLSDEKDDDQVVGRIHAEPSPAPPKKNAKRARKAKDEINPKVLSLFDEEDEEEDVKLSEARIFNFLTGNEFQSDKTELLKWWDPYEEHERFAIKEILLKICLSQSIPILVSSHSRIVKKVLKDGKKSANNGSMRERIYG